MQEVNMGRVEWGSFEMGKAQQRSKSGPLSNASGRRMLKFSVRFAR